MNRCRIKISIIVVVGCCFIAMAIGSQAGIAVESRIEQAANLAREGKVKEAEDLFLPMLKQKDFAVKAGHELGLIYYESNNLEKAVSSFETALTAAFQEPASGEIQKAVELAQSGKADEAEKILLSLLDEQASAARARYELGLIYEAQGKIDDSATMFRNALTVIANKGAMYVGVKTCKKCHLKLYKSWQKTNSAKSFETLKPGVDAEIKTKLKFDPQKDYTKDTKCLQCHTTGFGLPGGYRIPKAGDPKSIKLAKVNAGITCEGCHGPGSKYIPVLKEILTKKRKYTQQELCDLGQFKVGARVCSSCHNQRNPSAGSDYHFDFKEYKNKDTHEHFPLRYRKQE